MDKDTREALMIIAERLHELEQRAFPEQTRKWFAATAQPLVDLLEEQFADQQAVGTNVVPRVLRPGHTREHDRNDQAELLGWAGEPMLADYPTNGQRHEWRVKRILRDDRGPFEIPLHHYREHLDVSDSFAWGYWGSGPTQLSFAVLLDYLLFRYWKPKKIGDKIPALLIEIAKANNANFKREYIGTLDQNEGWVMSINAMDEWADTHSLIKGEKLTVAQ